MVLDETSFFKIKEIIREENDAQLKKIQEWTRDQFSSKLETNKKITELKEEHIQPLRVKVYGAIFGIGILCGGLQILLAIKG